MNPQSRRDADRRERDRRRRERERQDRELRSEHRTFTWAVLGLVSLIGGLLLLLIAFLAEALATLIWIDIGSCFLLATIFFLVHYVTNAPKVGIPTPSQNPNGLVTNLALVTAVIQLCTVLAGATLTFTHRDPASRNPPPITKKKANPPTCPETPQFNPSGQKS
jgi:uncharacterized membrane protein (DUF485 family)